MTDHYPVWRVIGWLDSDGETQYEEIKVCGTCVPKHSHFRSREEVPRYHGDDTPEVAPPPQTGPRQVTCKCDWPYGHCMTCAQTWGYTAVHMTVDGTCAMLGHINGSST